VNEPAGARTKDVAICFLALNTWDYLIVITSRNDVVFWQPELDLGSSNEWASVGW